MLEHMEGFELETKYGRIWDKIRYKKISEIESFTNEIIEILSKHIDDQLLFHSDYNKIQYLFKKMKMKNYFYMSGDARHLIHTVNPKFKNVYKKRKCVRKLKYLGSEIDNGLKKDKVYKSTHFNGATYTIKVGKKEKIVGRNYFKRLS